VFDVPFPPFAKAPPPPPPFPVAPPPLPKLSPPSLPCDGVVEGVSPMPPVPPKPGCPPPPPPEPPFEPEFGGSYAPPAPPPYAFSVFVPAPAGFSDIGAPAIDESLAVS
jgi:hypothetical protein